METKLIVPGGLGKGLQHSKKTLDKAGTENEPSFIFLFPEIRARLAKVGNKPRGLNRGSTSEALAGTYRSSRFTGTAFRLCYPKDRCVKTVKVERTYPKGEEPWLEELTITTRTDHMRREIELLFSKEHKKTLVAIQKEEDIELQLRSSGQVEITLGPSWFNQKLESAVGKTYDIGVLEQELLAA